MDSAFIHQAANELVQNVGTRNIKQIARSCSLDISETSRIKDMLGLLSLYFDKPLILINRQLDKQTKQMVCGKVLRPNIFSDIIDDCNITPMLFEYFLCRKCLECRSIVLHGMKCNYIYFHITPPFSTYVFYRQPFFSSPRYD